MTWDIYTIQALRAIECDKHNIWLRKGYEGVVLRRRRGGEIGHFVNGTCVVWRYSKRGYNIKSAK